MLRPAWIFLDFDGVLMDSMPLKLDAYCHALAEYGFAREDVRREQLRYAGLSRSRALPRMYRGLTGGRELPEDEAERVLRRFAEEDLRLRPRMRLLPGVEGFLDAAAARGIPLAVVTGTPQEVIDGTVDFFNLRGRFREVRGHPPGKAGHLLGLLARHGLRPEEAIYVGDAVLDHQAAAAAGIPFVGIDHGEHPFAGLDPAPVAELRGLGDLAALMGWSRGESSKGDS